MIALPAHGAPGWAVLTPAAGHEFLGSQGAGAVGGIRVQRRHPGAVPVNAMSSSALVRTHRVTAPAIALVARVGPSATVRSARARAHSVVPRDRLAVTGRTAAELLRGPRDAVAGVMIVGSEPGERASREGGLMMVGSLVGVVGRLVAGRTSVGSTGVTVLGDAGAATRVRGAAGMVAQGPMLDSAVSAAGTDRGRVTPATVMRRRGPTGRMDATPHVGVTATRAVVGTVSDVVMMTVDAPVAVAGASGTVPEVSVDATARNVDEGSGGTPVTVGPNAAMTARGPSVDGATSGAQGRLVRASAARGVMSARVVANVRSTGIVPVLDSVLPPVSGPGMTVPARASGVASTAVHDARTASARDRGTGALAPAVRAPVSDVPPRIGSVQARAGRTGTAPVTAARIASGQGPARGARTRIAVDGPMSVVRRRAMTVGMGRIVGTAVVGRDVSVTSVVGRGTPAVASVGSAGIRVTAVVGSAVVTVSVAGLGGSTGIVGRRGRRSRCGCPGRSFRRTSPSACWTGMFGRGCGR